MSKLVEISLAPQSRASFILDACRKRVKVGFRGRSSSLDDFEFVLLCVTGATLSSVLVEFRGRRVTLQHFV